MKWFTQSPEYRELDRFDGEPVVVKWTIFPGPTTLHLRQEIQSTMEEIKILRQKFEDRINFVSMYSYTDWRK